MATLLSSIALAASKEESTAPALPPVIFWTRMMQRERGYILAGFCYLAVSVAACCAADREDGNALTPEEKAAGWTLLFDGKTMHGWDDPRMKSPPGDAWTIEDGCLKANRNPRITEDLFTQDTFTDFELMLEWRISPGGNSGVKYRIQDHWFIAPKESGAPHERFEASVERSFLHRVAQRPQRGQDYVIGFEYQITDDAQNGDAKGNVKHTAGALYDMVAPSSAATRPVGEFNQSRILVRGNHVEHWFAASGRSATSNSLLAQAPTFQPSRGTPRPQMICRLSADPSHIEFRGGAAQCC